MATLMRHVGRLINTDKRVVVVFLQIPNREDHALVVDTDALPPKYHDELMAVVQGEGQKDPNLANILSRRIMPASGEDILSTLHKAGVLQPVPVSNVMMFPEPNRGVKLSDVIAAMKGSNQTTSPVTEDMERASIEKVNRIVDNQQISKDEQRYEIAKNLLVEAQLLEQEAERKRRQAFEYAPELRSNTKEVPVVPPIEEPAAPVGDVAPAPRKRGRPRKVANA